MSAAPRASYIHLTMALLWSTASNKHFSSTRYTSRYVIQSRANHGVSKQTLNIVPLSGQTTATNGQKVIVSLPPNSLVDLSTFEMNFVGATQHRGNNTGTNCANYVQKEYLPRNTATLIENLEIKINGQSRQNINQYGYISNILHGFTCGVIVDMMQ